MGHCVANYAKHCMTSMVRVFSVRYKKTGRHVATLSVEMGASGKWVIDDMRGPWNQPVHERLLQAAHGVIMSIEDAGHRSHNSSGPNFSWKEHHQAPKLPARERVRRECLDAIESEFAA